MKKKILALGVASLLFLGNPIKQVYAGEITSSEDLTSSEIITSSEEIGSSETTELENIINEQLAQIESIIVALCVSFT